MTHEDRQKLQLDKEENQIMVRYGEKARNWCLLDLGTFLYICRIQTIEKYFGIIENENC